MSWHSVRAFRHFARSKRKAKWKFMPTSTSIFIIGIWHLPFLPWTKTELRKQWILYFISFDEFWWAFSLFTVYRQIKHERRNLSLKLKLGLWYYSDLYCNPSSIVSLVCLILYFLIRCTSPRLRWVETEFFMNSAAYLGHKGLRLRGEAYRTAAYIIILFNLTYLNF